MNKSRNDGKMKSVSDINAFVLTESMNFLMPVAYLVCFVAAYYGPNAQLLGNVKNSYWQYQAVKDLSVAAKNILLIVCIDSLSLLIGGALFWITYKINLIKVYGLLFMVKLLDTPKK